MIRFQLPSDIKVDVEDIYQSLFLELVRRPLSEDIDDVRLYLYRAVANDIYDLVRRAARYNEYISECYDKDTTMTEDDVVERELIDEEETSRLCGFVRDKLHSYEAEAVILVCIRDYTIGAAARKMGVAKRTVSRYKCEGLRKLRSLFRAKEITLEKLDGSIA